jgi:hypothetical protein
MAICFQLVVNFGQNVEAARAAALAESPTLLHVGDHGIPTHKPSLMYEGPYIVKSPYIEVSVMPVAVSRGAAIDGTLPRFILSAAELSELGRQLYDRLARWDGYDLAMVGWEKEDFVDPETLRTEYREELASGSIHGLVLSRKMHADFGLGSNYVEFAPGFLWIPYCGEDRGND